jgi:hypothetical protein
MAKHQKLLQRLLSIPKDFTWDELAMLLRLFGFKELKTGKTSGSKRKFVDTKLNVINLHKPHPGKVVKLYKIRHIIQRLKECGYIKNE